MPLSPAGAGRLRRTIQALDADRVRNGNDKNRSAVPPVPASHGDRSATTPGSNRQARS